MPSRGRKDADEALLMALACGASVENAARQAGVSRRTAQRRLADANFCRRITEFQTDMVKRASGMLTAAALESVKTLLTLQAPPHPPAVRLGAARSVLEIGIKLRETAELECRLSALEQQLGVVNAGRRYGSSLPGQT
jgi:hypothetical protein